VTQNRYKNGLILLAFAGLIGAVPVTQWAQELAHGDRPQILDLFSHAPIHSHRTAFARDLRSQCLLAKIVRPWMQRLRFVALAETPAKTLVGQEGWLFYQPAVQYLIEAPPASNSPTQAEILTAVTTFRNQLLARGIYLLVIIAPNKASIYPDKLSPHVVSGSINPRTMDLMTKLQQAEVELVDLFSLFREARRTATVTGAKDYYLAQDSHWSPTGIELAAQTVATRLYALGWMKKQDHIYTLKPTPITRYGDIIAMMQIPNIQKYFQPESINCNQVVEADTQALYQDDPNSTVLVLGDSFLRIFSRDEPSKAGFVEHLAYHLGHPMTSIVNDGGASTLVRQQLARKPQWLTHKKVVIWEFVERDIRFGTEGWQVVPLPKERP
jgi:acetyltransferase AlgX (SGNH hydrolase-like protein)